MKAAVHARRISLSMLGATLTLVLIGVACQHALRGTGPAPFPAATKAPDGFRSEKAMKKALRSGVVSKTAVDFFDLDGVRVERDVRYSDGDERNVLDVYRGDGAEARPIVLFIHGGGWDHGDKKACAPYALHVATRGYLGLSMNYRLAPESTHPAQVDDVRAADRWATDHARAYGGDPERIALVGFSAGAHLAMLAAYEVTADSPRPDCVVDVYGPVDLAMRDARRNKAVRRLLGERYSADPEAYRVASPIAHVTRAAPPTLILHGDVDDQVAIGQADALAAALRQNGVPCVYERVAGWGHAMDRAQPMFDYCARAMTAFLDGHLR